MGGAVWEWALAMEPIALEPVDAITVTTLVDNVTDSQLADQGPARRPSTADAPRLPAPLLFGGETDDALRAEHGFSVLVAIAKGDRQTRVLFDAGRTPDGLVENMRRLELSPGDIDNRARPRSLAGFSPDYLVPAHCTGWRATHALAARFPEAFIQNSVGTRFEFGATDA